MADVFSWPTTCPVPIEVRHRVLKTEFGDGYAQRSPDGINTRTRRWRVEVRNQPVEDIELAARFIDEAGGVNPFFYATGDPSVGHVLVVCEEYTIKQGNNLATLEAVFEEYHGP